MIAHEIRLLTLHHTGTRSRPDDHLSSKLRDLQRFSQSRAELPDGRIKPAWPDVPYHFYIEVSGQIGEGRRPEFAGDTNTEYSPRGHLSIAVEGNFDVETPTRRQLESLETLVLWLGDRWDLSGEALGTHQDYVSSRCPGKKLAGVVHRLQARLTERARVRRNGAGPRN